MLQGLGPVEYRSQVMAGLCNTAIGLLQEAGFDNIAEANQHMFCEKTRPLGLLQI